MPAISFVADSTCDLPEEYRRRHGIRVVPLKVIFGDEELVDGVDIDARGFYERMRRESRNPRTSQPAPAEFEAAFREAAGEAQTIVCTTLSSEMSGTYGAAMTAREALPDVDIRVVDTRTVSIGHNNLLRAAVARAESGGGAEEVLEAIAQVIRGQRSVFTVATLEYLRRGGRIGGAKALLGSVLSIKPVLQVLDGRIERYKQVRTNQRAVEQIAEELVSAVGETGRRASCTLGSADRASDMERLAELVRPHCDEDPELIDIGPIVGCHAGPGTLGMSFFLR